MKRLALPAIALLLLGASVASAQQFVPGAAALDRWDGNRDNRVTLAELRAGRSAAFGSYDTNGDGVLSGGELGNISAQGNVRNTNQPMLRYRIDTNGDGLVTKAEFVDGSAEWLRRMDRDENGVLTAADFGRNARGAGQGFGRGQAKGRGMRWN